MDMRTATLSGSSPLESISAVVHDGALGLEFPLPRLTMPPALGWVSPVFHCHSSPPLDQQHKLLYSWKPKFSQVDIHHEFSSGN